MARYAYAWNVVGVSASAMGWLRSTTGKDMRIWEAAVYESGGTAAATDIGLGRPAAISVTPTTVVPQAEDTSSAAAVCTGQVAAGTKPTAPTLFLRRFGIPATLGAGVIWTFPEGLIVPSGPAELVVWNIGAATSTFSGYFVYDE
jgi:coproporphyrinogen III oxidase